MNEIRITSAEVKSLILSAQSIERESRRIKQEIDKRREELLSIPSALSRERIVSSEKLSMPERVCFCLESLYVQYSDVLQRLHVKRDEIEQAISTLEPLEQEIVRAWRDGKTEEQIGATVGYSDRTVRNYKKRILIKLSNTEKKKL